MILHCLFQVYCFRNGDCESQGVGINKSIYFIAEVMKENKTCIS